MPIEAELKARVRDREAVRAGLAAYGEARREVYHDTYYDDPRRDLTGRDQELRVRTIERDGESRTLLTFKQARVDEDSGSKPEYETQVSSAETTRSIVQALGFEPVISFQKDCLNYEFTRDGLKFLATLVEVHEINGTFLKVETLVDDPRDLPQALAAVRQAMRELGVEEGDLTNELYTEAVARTRSHHA